MLLSCRPAAVVESGYGLLLSAGSAVWCLALNSLVSVQQSSCTTLAGPPCAKLTRPGMQASFGSKRDGATHLLLSPGGGLRVV